MEFAPPVNTQTVNVPKRVSALCAVNKKPLPHSWSTPRPFTSTVIRYRHVLTTTQAYLKHCQSAVDSGIKSPRIHIHMYVRTYVSINKHVLDCKL